MSLINKTKEFKIISNVITSKSNIIDISGLKINNNMHYSP